MDWFRVNIDLPTHPKSKALARELGEPVSWWRIAQVWAWCVRYHRDGQIVGLDCHIDIEDAAGWAGSGTPGAFVRAAVRVGFLIEIENGYAVNDWMEHNGKAIKQSEKATDKIRKWRKNQKKQANSCNGNATVTLPISQNRNVTGGRDGTGRDVTDPSVTSASQTSGGTPPAANETSQPPKQKRSRKPSAWQQARAELRTMRAQKLGPGGVPDSEPSAVLVNEKFSEMAVSAATCGVGVPAAYAQFLADPYWGGPDKHPPWPLGAFLSQFSKYAAKAKTHATQTVTTRKDGSFHADAPDSAYEPITEETCTR